ncbi:hypothetical protein ONZ45_g3926 [Pleurotus djamor]|nr:hypothetical protein ONZ45_g3926 [Pleurotus djamor]
MSAQSRLKKSRISSSNQTPPPPLINKHLTSVIESGTSATPASHKNSGHPEVLEAPRRKKLMAQETIGHWVGPCPIPSLLDECMPLPENEEMPTDFASNHFQDKTIKLETDLSEHLRTLINGDDGETPLFPGWKIVDTSNHKDPNSKEATRVDLTLVQTAKYNPAHRHNKAITEMDIELKVIPSDAFNDNFGHQLEDDSEWDSPFEVTTGADTRGQLAMYASEICSRQHRTHLFMLYLCHPYARILRWDRSGVIVTERFNYVADCSLMVEYIWRFIKLNSLDRGFDPTVSLASEAETEAAHERLQPWKPKHPRDVLKIEVPHGKKTRYFLVWGAIAEPRSPFGRATRGYVAIEVLSRNRFSAPMFLKEQWRGSKVDSEINTLQKLKQAKVKHVPTLVCGGDFPEHTTRSDTLVKDEWRVGGAPLDSRTLTRLVVKEVGKPLSAFPDSKTLIQAIFDAFVGHQQAYKKCKILHRDVSAGNILILDNGHGLLSDWDLAKEIARLGEAARTHERTGTWAFMSVELSAQPDKCHSVQDDIESFFWVVFYHAIRYAAHDYPDVRSVISKVFDECYFHASKVVGGTAKHMLITKGTVDSRRVNFSCDALDDFIYDSRALLAEEEVNKIQAQRQTRVRRAATKEEKKKASGKRRSKKDSHNSDEEGNGQPGPSSTQPTISDSHADYVALFKRALKCDWPEDDAAVDYYQKQVERDRTRFVPAQPRTMMSSKSRSSQKRAFVEVEESEAEGEEEEETAEQPTRLRKSKRTKN